ncbi:response regulator transcription factor [Acetivibrio cellulolyticus]|uniref:response regulator transcription factor n=1 Tax=Acetivibrio cellulolyticus TaxID=35830 RepID=UPI0001E2C793|nr:response regulator transcription factor [Acetivibrio cellulolyticus]
MDKIKIAIIEDDIKWLQGLVSYLGKQDDFVIVFTAMSRTEAVLLSKDTDVDIIIMDINLQENKCDGILAAQEILEGKTVKIIMLTSFKDEDIIRDSFIAGAVNYITKDDYYDIPDVIRKTHKTGSAFEVILKDYARLKEQEQIKDLNFTEKEVFALIEKGYTREQIQEKLNKSESTLKKQIKQILAKLGVKSSKEAVQKVKRKGL